MQIIKGDMTATKLPFVEDREAPYRIGPCELEKGDRTQQ